MGKLMSVQKKFLTVSIDKLIPYENNPRINEPAIPDTVESIKQCENLDPIEVDEGFVILSGHTRLLALKQLGYTETEVLTEEQKRKYSILANKTNELADWDFSKLDQELADLDFSDFSFDFDGIEEQLQDVEVKEDEPPEPPEEPKAKVGDLYALGNHRLICGDSTDAAVIDRLMDGVKADMVFCDAPYGYKYESNYQDKYEMLQNDDKILDFIPAIWGVMKDNCPVYEFCGWQSLKQWLEYFENTSLDLKNVIIWKKNNWSMGDLKGAYAGQYEVILYLNKGRVELNGARDTDIWEFDREPPKMHPTMKPIELIAYALSKSSKKDDVVLDCFGGSGSTLIACEQTGRTCYMAELSPEYVDVIIARWEKLTGNKAVKLN